MDLTNILFAIGGVAFGTIVTTIITGKENREQQEMINKLNGKLVSEKIKNDFLMKMYTAEVDKNIKNKLKGKKKVSSEEEPAFPRPGDLGFGPGRINYGIKSCLGWTEPFSRPFLPYSARKEFKNNEEVKTNDEI